ncbi:hypothetical protein AA313_de0209285 [Arthrobotrys entomopaga]|nr:hypothetical protein AA313_de0209285 [Arthrobotrys entomopaga]
MATAASAANVAFNTYSNGDCTGTVTTRFIGVNGGGNTCHVFGGVSFGAQYEVTSGATCIFKSWENADCTGLATTRSIVGINTNCQPIANDNAGNFHVPNGLRSVSITCS